MTSDLQSTVLPSEAASPGQGQQAGGGVMAWNQPGFAHLWGLATAKDSLRYWLKRKSFSSFILSRWLFAVYFVLAALNGFVVFNRLAFADGGAERPTYPFVTLIVLLVVLGTTKERSQGLYFWAAWSFWIIINLIGFVNATSVSSENFRLVIQVVVKSWITLIGIPWMAFRIISPDKLQRYTKLLVLTGTVGSVMCLVQTANPALFYFIRDADTMRGAGTWDNANAAGVVLMLTLFLTRLVDWRSRVMKWTVYVILLAGFIGTFSRGALAGFFFGELIYIVIVRNYKRMFFSGLFLLLFMGSWVTIGFMIQNNSVTVESKEVRDRLQTVSNLFTGKGTQELETGRLYLWRAAVQEVLDEGSLLFGVGHVGLIKSKSLGLAPHNEYIQTFADGGLLGVAVFLSFLGVFAYIFFRCKDRVIRASLMSMIAGYSVYCMTADKIFFLQMMGPYIAIFVMWAHYSREYPGIEDVQKLRKSLARNLALANLQKENPE
jgi:O-Antigen ligase